MTTRRSAEKEEFWRLVISEQQRSGLSIKEFCKQQDVSAASFYAWRREVRMRDQPLAPAAQAILPVKVMEQSSVLSPSQKRSVDVEIELPAGIIVRLYGGANS